MGVRDLWRSLLKEVFTSEFGPEIAGELADVPLRERRTRIQAWYVARPSTSSLLLLPSRWHTVRFKLDVLRSILVDHAKELTPAAFTAISREVSELEVRVAQEEAELGQPEIALLMAEERLARVEQVLGYAGASAREIRRPLSIEGTARLKMLQEKAVPLITRKYRVQLLLEDFERFHERVAEADRPNVDDWLERLRDLHRAYEEIVSRMKEILRAEEGLVRQGYTADPTAFDRLAAEVATFDRLYEELRRSRSLLSAEKRHAERQDHGR